MSAFVVLEHHLGQCQASALLVRQERSVICAALAMAEGYSVLGLFTTIRQTLPEPIVTLCPASGVTMAAITLVHTITYVKGRDRVIGLPQAFKQALAQNALLWLTICQHAREI